MRLVKDFVILFFICVFILTGLPSAYPAETSGKQEFQGKNTTAYKKIIDKLNKDKKESILSARDSFWKLFPPESKDAQKGFRIFRKYYQETISEVDKSFYENGELLKLLNQMARLAGNHLDNPMPKFEKLKTTEAKQIRKENKKGIEELNKYRNCGMDFYNAEGDWYLSEDSEYLVKEVLPDYNFELKEYVIFLSKEEKQRLAEDAGLLITWEELRKRIIRWENFHENHQELLEAKTEIKPKLNNLVTIYLNGTDNSPIYDYKTNRLDGNLKISYESFLKKNRASSFYKLIKTAYDIYKKHDFNKNDELTEFLKKSGYEF
jgi:hypothetical protein